MSRIDIPPLAARGAAGVIVAWRACVDAEEGVQALVRGLPSAPPVVSASALRGSGARQRGQLVAPVTETYALQPGHWIAAITGLDQFGIRACRGAVFKQQLAIQPGSAYTEWPPS